MAVKICVWLIEFYQNVKKGFPPVCRFIPSCSQYTKEAVIKYGVIKGIFKGFMRICRCHPYNGGGYDPLD